MEKLLPMPSSIDELPLDFDVYKKGDWRGPQAKAYGVGDWLARRIQSVGMLIVMSALVGAGIAAGAFVHWAWLVPAGLLGVLYVLLRVFEVDKAAENAWKHFIQQLDDDVYQKDGIISEETRWHEAGHIWQKMRQFWGVHSSRYVLDPRGLPLPVLKNMKPYYRRHAEAQCYALEVAKGFDTQVEASKSMSNPVYALGVTEQDAFELIGKYRRRWEPLV
jgi:hypothetical protein